MGANVRVSLKRVVGPLFAPNVTARAIATAKKETLDYGQAIIQVKTPVDTGRLQAWWETDRIDTIFNEIPYSVYVEEGTSKMEGRFMAQRSLDEIGGYFSDRITKELDKALK